MRAYGLIGFFCNVPLPAYWDSGSELRRRIAALLDSTPLVDEVSESAWASFVERVRTHFVEAIDEWRTTYAGLLRAWQETDDSERNARRQANALRYQLTAFYEMTVIKALADEQFLPRYGFPIGLLRLRVLSVTESDQRDAKPYVRAEDQYRLERPGVLAMREYVPGASFFVGHKVVTSHGLLKHWTGANLNTAIGFRGQLAVCLNGHRFYSFAAELGPCPFCGETERVGEPKPLLFPRFGFSTAAWDRPTFRGAPSEPIGNAELLTVACRDGANGVLVRPDFAGLKSVVARYQEDGELLVVNAGAGGRGFAICLNCGFSESEPAIPRRGQDELPKAFQFHAPLTEPRRWSNCRKNHGVNDLRHQFLTARQVTDIVVIDVPQLAATNLSVATTMAHAFWLAGTRLLSLDSRELGSFVMATDAGDHCGLVIFDSMPGGAGHVAALLDTADEWARFVGDALFVSEEHHWRCVAACLDCLLSFETQFDHDQGLLARAETWRFWDQLRNGRSSNPNRNSQQANDSPTSTPSDIVVSKKPASDSSASRPAAKHIGPATSVTSTPPSRAWLRWPRAAASRRNWWPRKSLG